MRVLHVIDSLGAAGAERSLVEMLTPLHSRGVDSVVACLFWEKDGLDEVAAQVSPVHYLRGSRDLARIGPLRDLAVEVRPDLVHSSLIRSDLVARAAFGLRGTPVLTSLVNTTYERGPISEPLTHRIALQAWRSMDAVSANLASSWFHAISRTVATSSIRALGLPSSRVVVIPRGRDPRALGEPSRGRRLRTRRALEVPDDDFVVVNVGRQRRQKDQMTLVEAAAILRDRGRAATFLIVGREGPETPGLVDSVRRHDLMDRVRFLGHREDVADVLAAGDVFAFPSRYEGLGGSLLEAMALGLPIVASAIPVIEEVVAPGANAQLVPVGNAGAMADALMGLQNDSDRRLRWGLESRRVFEERFTLDSVVDRMVDLYAEVVRNPRPLLDPRSRWIRRGI